MTAIAVGSCSPVRVQRLEIDSVDGDRAVVVDSSGSRLKVPRGRLPVGVREGDVVVDGRLAPEQTLALRAEVGVAQAVLRARADRPASLEDPIRPGSPAGANAVSR